jgi:hypothetical protein
VLLIALAGCSTTKGHTRIKLYNDAGQKTADILCLVRGTVYGKGETYSKVEGACGTLVRKTVDTGLSPEGGKTARHAIDAAKAIGTGGASLIPDAIRRNSGTPGTPGNGEVTQ